MNKMERWSCVEKAEPGIYPSLRNHKVLLFDDKEVPLEAVVSILNGITDIYASQTKIRDQLEVYMKFFEDLQLIMKVPEDTKKELARLDRKTNSLHSDMEYLNKKLFKYGIR